MDDEALLRRIADTFGEQDAVPESAKRFALESHRLLSFESEVAELISDSLASTSAMRSSSDVRSLVFEGPHVSIRIELGSRTQGSVEPPLEGATVSIEDSDGERAIVAVSDSGFFAFDTPSSPFRVRIEDHERTTVTEWVRP